MQRVVLLGRGGAGKSTLAAELSQRLNLPHRELDQYFWQDGLRPLPPSTWTRVSQLASADRWIMDGDLGRYDDLRPRLERADTVIVLDYGLIVCLRRAARRSRERLDFWWWVVTWRPRSRAAVLGAIERFAPDAAVYVLRKPQVTEQLIDELRSPPG